MRSTGAAALGLRRENASVAASLSSNALNLNTHRRPPLPVSRQRCSAPSTKRTVVLVRSDDAVRRVLRHGTGSKYRKIRHRL